MRRRPFAIILFDEIEKADHDVFNILLQILEDGRLTDGQGRVVNFKNTLVIMTSNIKGELKDYFRPEFLNRIDEIITFNQLTEGDIARIVKLQLEELSLRLEDKKVTLEVSPAAQKELAQEGFDPVFGARPLKRLIQKKLQDQIALKLLSAELKEGDNVKVDYSNGDFRFTKGRKQV